MLEYTWKKINHFNFISIDCLFVYWYLTFPDRTFLSTMIMSFLNSYFIIYSLLWWTEVNILNLQCLVLISSLLSLWWFNFVRIILSFFPPRSAQMDWWWWKGWMTKKKKSNIVYLSAPPPPPLHSDMNIQQILEKTKVFFCFHYWQKYSFSNSNKEQRNFQFMMRNMD